MEVYHEIPIVALGSPSATILDILNEDCWRLILNLLHTEDIIRSERVSKQWQHVILRYLQGVHFSIESPCYDKDYFLNLRVLHLMREEDTQELDQITAKWGPNIKKAYCHNTKNLEVLARNCPNLEHIMFLDINDDVLPNGPQGNCWKLKTVFIGRYTNVQMTQVTDDGISKWLDNVYLEELLFLDAEKLTGQVLVDIQLANLTTLSLNYCLNLELRYLLAAADRLTSLKKLQLINFPKKISKDIHLFFDKLPNLEDLNLRWEKDVTVMITHKLAESIGRLELKRLDLSYNQNVNDDWLETVARGCGSQQELVMEGCFGVTSRGVIAMCRAAGPALRHLSVCGLNTMNDCHVEAFITACPNLTSLDLSYCMGISIYLVDTVAQAARGRHLRLYVDNTMVEDFHADPYPWLILDFSEQTSE